MDGGKNSDMKEQADFFESKLRFEIDAFDIFTAMNAGEKIVVIETRKREAYKAKHIPGTSGVRPTFLMVLKLIARA